MEFRFRAGEERGPELRFGAGDERAMRGFIGDFGSMGAGLMHARTSLEALEMELHEEHIREEIFARKLVQRRMLEEQVRWEMEMEHAMMIGRFPVEQMVKPIMPLARIDVDMERFGQAIVPHYGEVEFDERLPHAHDPEIEAGDKLPVPQIKSIQANPSKLQLSGMKRKAVATPGTSKRFPQPARKDWSCALCQVSATCEQGLKDHLEGKKHKTKAAQLSRHGASKKSAEAFANTSSKTLKQKAAVIPTEKGLPLPAQGSNKVNIKVDGKMHQVMQKKKYLWCGLCKVKCNSTSVMVAHLSGKKHRSVTGDSKCDDDNNSNELPEANEDSSEVVKSDSEVITEAAEAVEQHSEVKSNTEVIAEAAEATEQTTEVKHDTEVMAKPSELKKEYTVENKVGVVEGSDHHVSVLEDLGGDGVGVVVM